jgi:hypothetical protein
MELSKAIASIAVVLGVILAAGYAQSQGGDEGPAAPSAGATKPTGQARLEEREAERRAAVAEQERRKVAYEKACNRPLKTETDFETCRTAYKRLQLK